MNERAQYLLQILETIGSPLMGAITRGGDPDSGAAADAKAIAALLGKTVEASIDLGNIMDINPAEAQDDSLRVALAGLAGPLVAAQFEKRGDIPEAPQLKKMTTALQAVLTFSDNFAPTPETVERLKNLKASGQVVDTYQIQIQYMQAFIPVIEVIAEFPFGQPEQKLIMDVSNRLVSRAVELRETLLPEVSDEAEQKRAELGLLKALANVYGACHRAETQKVMNLSDDERAGGLSIDPVWAAFDTSAAMMETLASSLVPGGEITGGSAGPAPAAATVAATASTATATPPPPAQAEAPVQEPPAATAPQEQQAQKPQIFQAPGSTPPADNTTEAQASAEPPAAPPVPPAAPETPPAAPPAQEQPAGQNPMSMFAKKPEGGDTPPAAEQPPQPPAQETPPAAPTETPTPPAQPPAETPPQEQQPPTPPPQEEGGESDSGDQGSGGGSPMSFFKKSE